MSNVNAGIANTEFSKVSIQNNSTGNKDVREKEKGALEPKPPELFQKLLWIWKHGREHWRLILLAILIFLCSSIFVLPKFDLFDSIFKLLKEVAK